MRLKGCKPDGLNLILMSEQDHLDYLRKIVSGGQSGVDRAALDLALEHGIDCGGWCPRGRIAEDGPISAKYPLEETPSDLVEQRTEWNVRDSDATLIIGFGALKNGTLLTLEMTKKYGKPCRCVFYDQEINAAEFKSWLLENNVQTLNIAGPRESSRDGGVYGTARQIIESLIF